MNIAILSDIHSNYIALKTCIEHALHGGVKNDRTTLVLNRAKQLCKEDTGEANWPNIPDKYWEIAAREIGVI